MIQRLTIIDIVTGLLVGIAIGAFFTLSNQAFKYLLLIIGAVIIEIYHRYLKKKIDDRASRTLNYWFMSLILLVTAIVVGTINTMYLHYH